MCLPMCACVYMLMPPCVSVGVRAYPPVCVCTFLGPARELTGAEKTPASVAEETDIDAEDVVQVPTAEDLNLNRGVTDLDATAKTPDLTQSENKVNHTCRCSIGDNVPQGRCNCHKVTQCVYIGNQFFDKRKLKVVKVVLN